MMKKLVSVICLVLIVRGYLIGDEGSEPAAPAVQFSRALEQFGIITGKGIEFKPFPVETAGDTYTCEVMIYRRSPCGSRVIF